MNSVKSGVDEKELLANKLVVFIDDEADEILNLSWYFKRAGVQNFITATNARAGLQKIASLEKEPDVVLVDYFLIPGGGPDFIKEAMKVSPFKNLRYELMTGRDLGDLADVISLHKGAEPFHSEVARFIKETLL